MSTEMYQRMKEGQSQVPGSWWLAAAASLWTLAFIVLTMFYGFVLSSPSNPTSLDGAAEPRGRDGHGVTAELLMFIFFWVLTAVYVKRQHRVSDALNRKSSGSLEGTKK